MLWLVMCADDPTDPGEPIPIELTDELDLHAFHPRDVAGLVRDYLDHAAAAGWHQVRIVHGKGIAALARTVHAQCERHPAVTSFGLDAGLHGGWGVTIVRFDGSRARGG